MKSVLGTRDCYGCGVCAASCSRNAISMQLNPSGFYEPDVNEQVCVHCGVCVEVCSFHSGRVAQDESFDAHCFAGWSRDGAVRKACSSGGIAFEIARFLLKEDYEAVVCRYNPGKRQTEHYLAKTEEELRLSIGSKYLQSFTCEGFSQLRRGHHYLVVGTPCQIDSIRRWVTRQKMDDRVLLIDFFCHGVPSRLMWDKYLCAIENKTGGMGQIGWRDKSSGWHDSWVMKVDGHYASKYSEGDLFYRMYLKNRCLAKPCYDNCKFKGLKSAADIRIGDLWGSQYSENEEGVSGIAGLTKKGVGLLNAMDGALHLEPSTAQIVCEAQMKKCPRRPLSYRYVMKSLHSKKTLEEIDRMAVLIEQVEAIPRRMRYYAFRFPRKVKEVLQERVFSVKP